jgi:hypothetical protein
MRADLDLTNFGLVFGCAAASAGSNGGAVEADEAFIRRLQGKREDAIQTTLEKHMRRSASWE